MADCRRCGRDIDDPGTVTCSKDLIAYPDGEYLPRVSYDALDSEKCPVCHVRSGGIHHEGCYMERCPKCNQRLISCGCLKR